MLSEYLPSGYMQWLSVGIGLPAWNQVLTCTPPPAMEAICQQCLLGYTRHGLGARISLSRLQLGGAQQISQPATESVMSCPNLIWKRRGAPRWGCWQCQRALLSPSLSLHITWDARQQQSLLPAPLLGLVHLRFVQTHKMALSVSQRIWNLLVISVTCIFMCGMK